MFAQVPFRRILQAFVSYEVFSTSLPGEGLDFQQLDGDNEVLFSGVRLQLLPILGFLISRLETWSTRQKTGSVLTAAAAYAAATALPHTKPP